MNIIIVNPILLLNEMFILFYYLFIKCKIPHRIFKSHLHDALLVTFQNVLTGFPLFHCNAENLSYLLLNLCVYTALSF